MGKGKDCGCGCGGQGDCQPRAKANPVLKPGVCLVVGLGVFGLMLASGLRRQAEAS
jgi:hypothetical protein